MSESINPKVNIWPQIIGPIATLAALIAIELLARTIFRIPNPPAILIMIVVFSAFTGGLGSGLASSAIAWIYSAYFFSIPGQPFHYTRNDLNRLIVFAVTIPSIALMTGLLKRRADRASEKVLSESEGRFRQLSEAAFEGIAIHENGKILDANKSFATLFGYELSEVIGKHVLEFAAAESRDLVLKNVLAGYERPYEAAGLKRDGTTFSCEVCGKNVSCQGRMSRVTAIRDITERKRAEEALKQSKEWIAAIFDASRDGIVVEENERIVYANRSYARLYGYDDPKELIGVHLSVVQSPEDNERMLEFGRRRLLGETVPPVYEFKGIRKDGTLVELEASVSTSTIAGKAYIITVVHDNAERKRAEEALRRSEERYRLLFERNLAGIYRTTPDGQILDCNESLVHLLGYESKEELLSCRALDLYPEQKMRESALSRLLEQKMLTNFEVCLKRKDGSLLWGLENVTLLPGSALEPSIIEGTIVDITERKRAEEELRRSETRYRLIARATNDAIWDADLTTDKVEWNESVQTLFGYSADEVGPNSSWWFEHIHPEDRKRVTSRIRDVIDSGGQIWSDEYRFLCGDGSYAFVIDRGYVVHDEKGRPVRMMGAMLDVTEGKLAEEALRESEERFRQVAENMQDVLWVADNEFKQTLYVNKAYETIWGRTRESLYQDNKSFVEAVHPEDRERIFRMLKRQAEGIFEHTEYRIVRPDGSVRWILDRAFPIRDDSGRVYRIAGIAEDVTERKQTEEALQKGNNLLQAVVEGTTDAVFVKDINGRYLMINSSGASFIGKSVEEVIGKDDTELFSPDTARQIMEDDRRIMAAGKTQSFERSLTAAGVTRTYLSTKGPYRGQQGNIIGLVGVSRDITERKQAEEQIKASLKEKEVLLKEIHHRVKNNLQVISSLLSLQSGYIKDKKAIEMFKESQNRVRSMALIHEKLYQSKDLSRIDFAEYIQNLAAYLFRLYEINSDAVRLKIDVNSVLLSVDTAIPCGLIVNELVSNSLKYAFPAGRSGEICIGLNSNAEGKFTLVVSDNGVGLPKGLDFRETESLGLQLVNALTSQLDGAIELHNNGGAIFKITFAELRYKERG